MNDKSTVSANLIIVTFNEHVDGFISGEVFSQGAVVGVLKKACGSDSRYRQVLKALTGKTSSKEINAAQWHALCKFVNPIKPMGEKWQSGHGDETLTAWCNALVRHMDEKAEQTTFLA